MKRHTLATYRDGWFCGRFSPSIIFSEDFEVAVKRFSAGDSEVMHYQLTATELTCVILGEVQIGGEVFGAGEICEIPPGISADFSSTTDSILVVVKAPSLPDDKVIAE